MIEIHSSLSIPGREVWFTASRSSGPGGQHVNKVNSRVTLHFDLERSPSLDESQKRCLARRLATRVNKSGILKLHAQRHRSQAANRALLLDKFSQLLEEALRRRRPRKKTRPGAGAIARRIQEKKRRSVLKKRRAKVDDDG